MVFPAFRVFTALMGLALAATSLLAAAQQPAPGTYVTEGGWGTLSIKPNGAFQLDAVGSNAHVCGVEGRIVAGRATLDSCVIDFKPAPGQVSVVVGEKAQEACRQFCGARAWIAGDYFTEVPACREVAVTAARNRFLGLYRGLQYREATAVLGNLLQACGKFLYWTEDAAVRNDLALASSRSGDNAACLKALEPLRRNFIEGEVTFAPSDAEWGERMVKATRFNWKLCGGPLPGARR